MPYIQIGVGSVVVSGVVSGVGCGIATGLLTRVNTTFARQMGHVAWPTAMGPKAWPHPATKMYSPSANRVTRSIAQTSSRDTAASRTCCAINIDGAGYVVTAGNEPALVSSVDDDGARDAILASVAAVPD